MTEDEQKLYQNVVRVGGNLMVLLDIGLFPGVHSIGLSECKDFVRSVVEDAKKKAAPTIVPPSAPIPLEEFEPMKQPTPAKPKKK